MPVCSETDWQLHCLEIIEGVLTENRLTLKRTKYTCTCPTFKSHLIVSAFETLQSLVCFTLMHVRYNPKRFKLKIYKFVTF